MPDPSFAAGEKLTALKLQALGDDIDWTPTLGALVTAPTLGTGSSQLGVVWRNGSKVDLWFEITFGSSGVAAGSGSYYVALPSLYTFGSSMVNTAVGTAWLSDSSGSDYAATLVADTANNRLLFMLTFNNATVNASTPVAWAAGDILSGHATYLTG